MNYLNEGYDAYKVRCNIKYDGKFFIFFKCNNFHLLETRELVTIIMIDKHFEHILK